jgi:hypothetical protein
MIATTIADVPTRTVPAVAPDTPATVAAGRLRETGAPALPVVDAGSLPALVTASALAPYVPRYRLSGTGPTGGTATASPGPEPEPDADGTTVSPARRSGGEGPTAAGSTSQ